MITNYLAALESIHRVLRPRTYLEIGVRYGRSFKLSQAESIGIDPDPESTPPTHRMTSDEYFSKYTPFDGRGIDFAFIDGMHWLEYALRDFINTEKYVSHNAVIAFDDVLPQEKEWATRERKTVKWTGDIWKIVPILRQYRPELRLTLLDTDPGGLLLVENLNPKSKILSEQFDQITTLFPLDAEPPGSVLIREGAISLTEWLARETE